MATLDLERGTIVIRVVYDGPPRTGKTTSVRRLAMLLAERRRSEVFSPGESDGRTTYFDWMEYVGGLMSGYPVTCQIVSVPGQDELVSRREILIAGADVVVFVCASTPDGFPASLAHLERTRRHLASLGTAPVGIVVQLNKRDLPDAIPLGAAQEALAAIGQVGLVESVANEGRGIRETFVFAVRLALDRARQLMHEGHLPTGRPEVDSGEGLLAAIERDERHDATIAEVPLVRGDAGDVSRAPHEGAASVRPTPRKASENGVPWIPSEDLPSGLVWPPIQGRIVLHELEAAPPRLRPSLGGDWGGETGRGLVLLSRRHEQFEHLEQGRQALLHVARTHAGLKSILSGGRSAALAEAAPDRWRIWTFLRREASLRDALVALSHQPPRAVAEGVLAIAAQIEEAALRFRTPAGTLALSLDTINAPGQPAQFIDFLPATLFYPAAPLPPPPLDAVRRLLKIHLHELAERGAFDPRAVAAALFAGAGGAPARERLGFELAALVTQ